MDWAGIVLDAERNQKTVVKEGLISGDLSEAGGVCDSDR
jgi:hypothetical protein